MLHNLTPEFSNTVGIITQGLRANPDLCTINRVFNYLIDEAKRIYVFKDQAKSHTAPKQKATATSSTSKKGPKRKSKKTCTHCKKSGHLEETCWMKYLEKKPSKNSNTTTTLNSITKELEDEDSIASATIVANNTIRTLANRTT